MKSWGASACPLARFLFPNRPKGRASAPPDMVPNPQAGAAQPIHARTPLRVQAFRCQGALRFPAAPNSSHYAVTLKPQSRGGERGTP